MPGYTYTFAIAPVGNPGAEVDTAVSTFASGQLATANLAAGVLVDGMTYTWRVRLTDGTNTSRWSRSCLFTYDVTPPASAPVVTSANYAAGWTTDNADAAGQLAQFTFSDPDPSVYAYVYQWGELPVPVCSYSGPQGQLSCPPLLPAAGAVAAGPGGTSSIKLAPPDSAGPKTLSVVALDRAGNESPATTYETFVPQTNPSVTVVGSTPNCGHRVQLTVSPDPVVGPVRAYQYSVDSGPWVIVKANATGSTSMGFTVPDDFGFIQVESISQSGFVSTPFGQPLSLDPRPAVQASPYQNGQSAGGVGIAGTFTFSPPFDGSTVSSYTYRFGSGPSRTVPVDPNSQSATIRWTPKTAGPVVLSVTSNGDQGTSCRAGYSFIVAG